MPIKKVMYTVKQRAVGNNVRLQDGTKIDRVIHHANTTSIEVQQPETEGRTSQEEVSPAVTVVFPVAVEVFLAVEAVVAVVAEEDVDSAFRAREMKISMMKVHNYNE